MNEIILTRMERSMRDFAKLNWPQLKSDDAAKKPKPQVVVEASRYDHHRAR